MKKKNIQGKFKNRKGGYAGNEIWEAHRLEGVVKNVAIKPKKKNKKISNL